MSCGGDCGEGVRVWGAACGGDGGRADDVFRETAGFGRCTEVCGGEAYYEGDRGDSVAGVGWPRGGLDFKRRCRRNLANSACRGSGRGESLRVLHDRQRINLEVLRQFADGGRVAWWGSASGKFPVVSSPADVAEAEALVEQINAGFLSRRRGSRGRMWCLMPEWRCDAAALSQSGRGGWRRCARRRDIG